MFLYYYKYATLKCHPFKLWTFVNKLHLSSAPLYMKHRVSLNEKKLVNSCPYCDFWLPCNTLLDFALNAKCLISWSFPGDQHANMWLLTTKLFTVCKLSHSLLTKAFYHFLDKSWDKGAQETKVSWLQEFLHARVKSQQVHPLRAFSTCWHFMGFRASPHWFPQQL